MSYNAAIPRRHGGRRQARLICSVKHVDISPRSLLRVRGGGAAGLFAGTGHHTDPDPFAWIDAWESVLGG